MAAQPSAFGVSTHDVQNSYGTIDFIGALGRFVVHFRHPHLSKAEVEAAAEALRIPFSKLSVFHRIKFVTRDPYSLTPDASIVTDSIHCEPPFKDAHGKVIPGRFDTAVVNVQNGSYVGVKGYRVAQVRVVFRIPCEAAKMWLPADLLKDLPPYLAYVEWFEPFTSARLGRDHRMYKVSKLKRHGKQQASVVSVDLIRQSVHLIPVFGPVAPEHWTSSNVLDTAQEFLVNSFSDRFQYSTLL